MVRFNGLSEGEKFAFSRDFLVKFKVMQRLRPELTEEKDVLTFVAKKFYDGDMTNLEECIKFMEQKVQINNLSTVNLDEPVREYEESLKKSIEERDEKLEKERIEEEAKLREYRRETTTRNYFDREFNSEVKRRKRNTNIKNVLVIALFALALIALPAMGGLVGLGNSILAFIADLSSIQLITLGSLVYFGLEKGWMKNLKGKIDGIKKGRKDKGDKRLAQFKENQELHQKEQQRIADEHAKIRASRLADIKEQEKALRHFEAEKMHLGRYQRITNFDKVLKMSEIEIKDQYEKALRMYDYEDEKKNLGKWYEHYVGSLYYGAYTGALQSKTDIENLVAKSGAKFEQLANPLNLNRIFSEENVRAQNDIGVNKPLEELYQSI